MYRVLLLALGAGLLAIPTARGDALPPPGLKRVPLDHKITTEKEYPDYLFFTSTGGTGPRSKLAPVTLDPKHPVTFAGAGRNGINRQGALLAVPKGAEKNYDSEEKFHAAIKDRKVEGLLQTKTNLDSATAIKDADKRTVVVYEVIVEKVDPKEGIVVKIKRDEEPKKDGAKKDSPEDDDTPAATVSAPRGGVWVAGVAAFAAITLGGMWLAGRTRRKV